MILEGIEAVRIYRDNRRKENFKDWGIRRGHGPIGPVAQDDFDPQTPWHYAEDYPGPGLDVLFFDIPNH